MNLLAEQGTPIILLSAGGAMERTLTLHNSGRSLYNTLRPGPADLCCGSPVTFSHCKLQAMAASMVKTPKYKVSRKTALMMLMPFFLMASTCSLRLRSMP